MRLRELCPLDSFSLVVKNTNLAPLKDGDSCQPGSHQAKANGERETKYLYPQLQGIEKG